MDEEYSDYPFTPTHSIIYYLMPQRWYSPSNNSALINSSMCSNIHLSKNKDSQYNYSINWKKFMQNLCKAA